MPKSTSYGTTPHSVVHPDGSWLGGSVNTAYDNAEFASGIVSDYDVGTNESDAFNNITTARFVSIRTDAAITVKFNSTSNASVTIDASTTFNVDTLEVTNIFLTAAASASVKIFLS
ncbi:MAG TPA: hypothetical protein ENI13_02065 [candidate division CPR3 bacterium]|uniref:Uncharacterized protein n=1 Tax=candidate division CPR3 bacterium TaxID=2268181 RepID=A0A7C1NM15_UNCC3|nr:hypothetical protein [candidate division CPR3 bacterium]